jgi:hypothetical protein
MNIKIGMVFCHDKKMINGLNENVFPTFKIHRCSGNKPIFKVMVSRRIKENVNFHSKKWVFLVNIKNKNVIDPKVWITKYRIIFSILLSKLEEKRRMNEMVIVSKKIHIKIVDLEEKNMKGEIVNVSEKNKGRKLLIYKKIKLSMEYESISFFSLSYFISKNCKFLMGKPVIILFNGVRHVNF